MNKPHLYPLFSLLLLSTCSFFTACKGGEKATKPKSVSMGGKTEEAALKIKNHYDQFCYILEGSFSSEAQHKESPLEYYHVVLHVYPIWQEQTGARWFYVEQALATLSEEPYRQRIYKVTQIAPDSFVSANYLLPEPRKYIGAWKQLGPYATKDNPFEDLRPDDLTYKDGCDVLMGYSGPGLFIGRTEEGTCKPTERKDAAYVITEVTMTFRRMSTWDRGMNEKGERVWGAAKRSYLFERMTDEQLAVFLQGSGPKE